MQQYDTSLVTKRTFYILKTHIVYIIIIINWHYIGLWVLALSVKQKTPAENNNPEEELEDVTLTPQTHAHPPNPT